MIMREQIKDLMLQAGYLPDGFGIGHWDMPESKKFVELLVKECIRLAGPEDSYRDDWFNAKVDSEIKIRHFFDVE